MGHYAELKTAIENAITTNGIGTITGEIMQTALLSIVNNLGKYGTCAGIASPTTDPGTIDQNVFYFATQLGSYTHFNISITTPGLYILVYDSTRRFWMNFKLIDTNTSEEAYSRNSSSSTADGRLTLMLSGNESKYVVQTTLSSDVVSVAVDFADNYFGDSFNTTEVIVAIKCTSSTTVRLGNTGCASVGVLPTSWDVPANGVIALQLLKADSSFIMAIPLFITPSASSSPSSGPITTQGIADGAVTRVKLNQEVLTELLSAKTLLEGAVDVQEDTSWNIEIGRSIASEYRLNYHATADITEHSEDGEVYISLGDYGTEGIGRFILTVRNQAEVGTFETIFFDDSRIKHNGFHNINLPGGETAIYTLDYVNGDDKLMVTSVLLSNYAPLIPEATTNDPGLMSASDKEKLNNLPMTSIREADQFVLLKLEGSLGMHAAGGLRDLTVDLSKVTSTHNFFKHTIYVSDLSYFNPHFDVKGLNGFTLKNVCWNRYQDGGSYDNVVTYPQPSQANEIITIDNPRDHWGDVQGFIKIEIEGFSIYEAASANSQPAITITVTDFAEI